MSMFLPELWPLLPARLIAFRFGIDIHRTFRPVRRYIFMAAIFLRTTRGNAKGTKQTAEMILSARG